MLLLTIVAPVLAANCYLVAAEGSRDCVVVDPGIGLDDALTEAMTARSLRPVAAVVTHGHVDHTFGVAELCRRFDVPAYVHEADAYRLADPIGTLGPALAPAFAAYADRWTPPADVRPFAADAELELAGLRIRAVHAPGHTEGSTLYYVRAANEADGLCFTGDVLFAGTIGRTDLAGGDDALMARTLDQLARGPAEGGLPAATQVLPGHGPASTFGAERATNPYLRQFQANQ